MTINVYFPDLISLFIHSISINPVGTIELQEIDFQGLATFDISAIPSTINQVFYLNKATPYSQPTTITSDELKDIYDRVFYMELPYSLSDFGVLPGITCFTQATFKVFIFIDRLDEGITLNLYSQISSISHLALDTDRGVVEFTNQSFVSPFILKGSLMTLNAPAPGLYFAFRWSFTHYVYYRSNIIVTIRPLLKIHGKVNFPNILIEVRPGSICRFKTPSDFDGSSRAYYDVTIGSRFGGGFQTGYEPYDKFHE
jgi:hypothetical protein